VRDVEVEGGLATSARALLISTADPVGLAVVFKLEFDRQPVGERGEPGGEIAGAVGEQRQLDRGEKPALAGAVRADDRAEPLRDLQVEPFEAAVPLDADSQRIDSSALLFARRMRCCSARHVLHERAFPFLPVLLSS